MEPTVPIPGLKAYIADEVDAFRAELDVSCRDPALHWRCANFDHAAFDRGSSEIYDMMVQRQVDRLVYENKNLYRELKELRLSAELQSACGQ